MPRHRRCVHGSDITATVSVIDGLRYILVSQASPTTRKHRIVTLRELGAGRLALRLIANAQLQADLATLSANATRDATSALPAPGGRSEAQ